MPAQEQVAVLRTAALPEVVDPRPGHQGQAARRTSGRAAELAGARASTSGVFARLHSRSGGAAALLVLVVQLLFTGLAPVADARAAASEPGARLGVHMERPGVHHHVHDSSDCVFCVSLQLGAVPAHFGRAPAAGSDGRLPVPVALVRSYTPVVLTSQLARAPPFAA